MANPRTKQLLANYIGSCLNSWWAQGSLPELERVEITRLTDLRYLIKIWEEDDAPRYFQVTIKETK